MYVDAATIGLISRLALMVVFGLAAVMAFVVLTVDRLNSRIGELERHLAGAAPRLDPASAVERDLPARHRRSCPTCQSLRVVRGEGREPVPA
jgi:hypothetical protein